MLEIGKITSDNGNYVHNTVKYNTVAVHDLVNFPTFHYTLSERKMFREGDFVFSGSFRKCPVEVPVWFCSAERKVTPDLAIS